MVWFFWIIGFTFLSEGKLDGLIFWIIIFTFSSEGKLEDLIFLDYSFHFLKVGNLREGEALIVAKAVSPSRALPLLATPLWCVVECVSVSAQSCILLYRQWQAEPIIISGLYSAVSAVTGWADYYFWIVFCCIGSDRLSRLLFLDCILLYRQWQAEAIIISGLYSAALAGADWADYYFWIVFCCTGRGRLSRLLLLHCLLLLDHILLHRQ